MSLPFQTRIGYPFMALFTVNLRGYIFSKRMIQPFIIYILPVLLLFIWRIIAIVIDPPPGSPIADSFEQYSNITSFMYLYIIIPLIAIMLGTDMLSEEWQTGTMLLLQIRPVPRWVISAGKLAAYIVFCVLMLSGSLIISFLIAASLPDSGMIPNDLDILFRDLRIYSLGFAVYGSVMMLVGIYFRRPLMFGIVLLFIWDQFGAYLPGYAHRLTIRFYMQSLLPGASRINNMLESFITHVPASTFESVAVLLGVIVFCIFLSSFILSRKTIQPESSS